MSTHPIESKSNSTEDSATVAYAFWVDRERRENGYSSEVEDKPTKKFKMDRVIASREYIDETTQRVTKAVIEELQHSPLKLSDELDDEDDDDDESCDSHEKCCNPISPKRRDEIKKEKMNTMRDYIEDLAKYEPMRRDFDKTFEPTGEFRILNNIVSD
jgi:hypothetical protein